MFSVLRIQNSSWLLLVWQFIFRNLMQQSWNFSIHKVLRRFFFWRKSKYYLVLEKSLKKNFILQFNFRKAADCKRKFSKGFSDLFSSHLQAGASMLWITLPINFRIQSKYDKYGRENFVFVFFVFFLWKLLTQFRSMLHLYQNQPADIQWKSISWFLYG